MTKLSDLQLILLATAVQREDGSILPPPERLGDQAARIRKAIPPLLKRGLIEEVAVTDGARVWREEAGQRIGLIIAAAGRAIIAAEDDGGEDDRAKQASAASSKMEIHEVAAGDPVRTPGTKIGTVLALLRRPEGATLAELVSATGWLPHTTRAALTGLRKKGHAIARAKRDDATCYSIGAAA